jgi:hypothetical protein
LRVDPKGGSNFSPLWELYQDVRLRRFEALCLMFTFDYAFIKKADLPEMAASYREFMTAHPNKNDHICHLSQWADDMNAISQNKRDDAGICFYMCSVSINVWDKYSFSQNKHFDIFEDYNLTKS